MFLLSSFIDILMLILFSCQINSLARLRCKNRKIFNKELKEGKVKTIDLHKRLSRIHGFSGEDNHISIRGISVSMNFNLLAIDMAHYLLPFISLKYQFLEVMDKSVSDDGKKSNSSSSDLCSMTTVIGSSTNNQSINVQSNAAETNHENVITDIPLTHPEISFGGMIAIELVLRV